MKTLQYKEKIFTMGFTSEFTQRESELNEARNELRAYLKHHHVNQGEQLVTSFGTFTRIDFHSNYLGTIY